MWAARVSQKYSQSLQEVTNSGWMEGAAKMFAELAALILHLNCSWIGPTSVSQAKLRKSKVDLFQTITRGSYKSCFSDKPKNYHFSIFFITPQNVNQWKQVGFPLLFFCVSDEFWEWNRIGRTCLGSAAGGALNQLSSTLEYTFLYTNCICAANCPMTRNKGNSCLSVSEFWCYYEA